MKLDTKQKAMLQHWSKSCKAIYNQAIALLNEHQGIGWMGEAKGSKKQQFKTLSMRTWVDKTDIPSKLIHTTLIRAYNAWSQTKRKNGKRIADKFVGDFTIETCPTAWNKGHLYPKFWKGLNSITLLYNHKEVQILPGNCLTIYRKYGRWYLNQPSNYQTQNPNTEDIKAIGLDPGLRNFMTGFDGYNFIQITNPDDSQRLMKLAKYIDKLVANKNKVFDSEHRRKIISKIKSLRRKLSNLKKELNRKLACWLAKSYDVIFIPDFKVKNIFSRKKNNKTNNRLSRLLSHFEFRSLLAYHCAKNGSVMVTVNEAYSSKTCSKCGHVHQKLGSKKVFNCPNCGHHIDRDLNGAVNIYHNSLAISQGGPGYRTVVQ